MLRAAEAHYRRQARFGALAALQASRLWGQVTPATIGAWDPVRAARMVAGLQVLAARDADTYVGEALSEQGERNDTSGRVNAVGFTTAGDGRPLVSLLDEPRIGALTRIGQGVDEREAYDMAARSLQLMAVTAVQDAGRAAVATAICARPQVGGYVRMLNPPSCSRCAVLAGKWFRWNQGFARHPKCDCRHVPASEDAAGDLRTDPDAMVRSGQVTGLSAADRRALAEGADLGQVVNARRLRSGLTTSEGTTRRGLAGQRLRGQARLTPEGIFRQAGNDRAEAIGLLRLHGYLI